MRRAEYDSLVRTGRNTCLTAPDSFTYANTHFKRGEVVRKSKRAQMTGKFSRDKRI